MIKYQLPGFIPPMGLYLTSILSTDKHPHHQKSLEKKSKGSFFLNRIGKITCAASR